MKALLDTCVLAEIRHPKGNPKVKSAVAKLEDEAIFLSALTLGEIAKGIALLPEGTKKRELSEWLRGLDALFSGRILPIDGETAQLWGELTGRAQLQGVVIPGSDGLVAATALRNALTVWTRNTRHFAATGAMVFDPWEAAEA